jgi:hypothetical protein
VIDTVIIVDGQEVITDLIIVVLDRSIEDMFKTVVIGHTMIDVVGKELGIQELNKDAIGETTGELIIIDA